MLYSEHGTGTASVGMLNGVLFLLQLDQTGLCSIIDECHKCVFNRPTCSSK